jgi:hypothetical protein
VFAFRPDRLLKLTVNGWQRMKEANSYRE